MSKPATFTIVSDGHVDHTQIINDETGEAVPLRIMRIGFEAASPDRKARVLLEIDATQINLDLKAAD